MPRNAVLALALVAAAAASTGSRAAERVVTTAWKGETRQTGTALHRAARTEGHLGAMVTVGGPELVLSFECSDATPPVLLVGVGAPAEPAALADGRPPAQVAIAFEFRSVTPHWLNRAIGSTVGEEFVPEVARGLDGVRSETRTVIGTDAARRGAGRIAAVRGDDMSALAELMRTYGTVTVHMGRDGTRFSLAGAAAAMAATGCPTLPR